MMYGMQDADRNALEDWARKGKAISESTAYVDVARNLVDDDRYRWGFDVGTAVNRGTSNIGPNSNAWREKVGPLSRNAGAIRGMPGSAQAAHGFDVAQALQHGVSKLCSGAVIAGETHLPQGMPRFGLGLGQPAGAEQDATMSLGKVKMPKGAYNLFSKSNAGMTAGVLIASGLVGSNSSANTKAAVMKTVTANPTAKAGAAAVVAKAGVFHRILVFFGLAK